MSLFIVNGTTQVKYWQAPH